MLPYLVFVTTMSFNLPFYNTSIEYLLLSDQLYVHGTMHQSISCALQETHKLRRFITNTSFLSPIVPAAISPVVRE